LHEAVTRVEVSERCEAVFVSLTRYIRDTDVIEGQLDCAFEAGDAYLFDRTGLRDRRLLRSSRTKAAGCCDFDGIVLTHLVIVASTESQ
jgi:hypothetical protein